MAGGDDQKPRGSDAGKPEDHPRDRGQDRAKDDGDIVGFSRLDPIDWDYYDYLDTKCIGKNCSGHTLKNEEFGYLSCEKCGLIQ